MKHVSLRLPEDLVRKAGQQKLRSYVARNDQIPRSEESISRSDVIRVALAFGLEVLARRADADLAMSGTSGLKV